MIKTKDGHCVLKGNIPQLNAELGVTIKAVHSATTQAFTAEMADTLIRICIATALKDDSLNPEAFENLESEVKTSNDK